MYASNRCFALTFELRERAVKIERYRVLTQIAMEKYAEQLINKMLADKLSYAEMVKVISIIDARLNNVRKVTKKKK